jgi:hypothetical protein
MKTIMVNEKMKMMTNESNVSLVTPAPLKEQHG